MYSPPILHQLAAEASMPNGDERIKSYANPQAREDPWMEWTFRRTANRHGVLGGSEQDQSFF